MSVSSIIGMDIGASKIAVGIVKKGQVSQSFSVPTMTDSGPKAVLQAIESALTAAKRISRTSRVGIGIAGSTDEKRGVFLEGPNFPKGFKNIRLRELVKKKFGADVRVANDVQCFTLGEATHGKGKRYSRVVGITAGTGIGGGLVTNNHLERGSHGTAMEVGHLVIQMTGGLLCGCGLSGHLEAYASGRGIARAYLHQTKQSYSAKEISQRAKTGDKHAKKIYVEAKKAFSVGLANIIYVVDPDIIIVGGGLAKDDLLWSGVRKTVDSQLIFPSLKKVRIARTSLYEKATILGAAELHGKA